MNSFNKVFGIGLNRTGTSSLNVALNILGIHTIHYPIDRTTYRELTTGNYQLSILEKYDGITDITVSPYYVQLDQTYPGSKFILTTRDLQSWLRSIERWYNDPSRMKRMYRNNVRGAISRFLRASMYGVYHFQEERMTHVYHQHYDAVTSHFKDRDHSLLVLDIYKGEGWQELCDFLERDIPDQEFPNWQKNKQKYNMLNPRRNKHFK